MNSRYYLTTSLKKDLSFVSDSTLKLKRFPLFFLRKRILYLNSTNGSLMPRKYTVAYKPNVAFYECYGSKGWKSLEATVNYIKDKLS